MTKFQKIVKSWHLENKKKHTHSLANAVDVLGLHPAWSYDAINEIKSLTRLAMGGLR